MIDFGYDPASMRDIDPMFGTMEDMKRLIRGAHDRGEYSELFAFKK